MSCRSHPLVFFYAIMASVVYCFTDPSSFERVDSVAIVSEEQALHHQSSDDYSGISSPGALPKSKTIGDCDSKACKGMSGPSPLLFGTCICH